MADPTVSSEVSKWLAVIAAYNGQFKKWEGRTEKILKRYRDDSYGNGTTGNSPARFNILWSNVQTLIPAVYAKIPKADVSRRFGDNDPVGRVASMLIERALDYEIEHYPDFRSAMSASVQDRFLGGRGVSWVRYDPHIVQLGEPDDGLEITEDVEAGESNPQEQDETAGIEEPDEEIEYECCPTDYVHWKDFGHAVARTWEEVTAVWRWVYMSKDAVTERFGEELANKIQYNSSPDTLTKYGQGSRINDKAKIAEIWDKEAEEVIWIHEDFPKVLDVRPDPLELEGFFPCPKPLYATTTSDNLIPTPDYILYQDQARELDTLTNRIDGFVQALRVRGIYDSSQPALQRLLTEGDNNTLIPTDKWSAFSEKGGLKGSIDLLPLDMLAEALLTAYQAQNNIKQQIYEITGISDIIRGQTHASESATAQQIKGQYAGLRLRSMQDSVEMFASELLRLKAQVICTKYQPKTIMAYAAADQLTPEDQQLIPQALELIKSYPLRSFRVDVAADSLVQLDENQVKQDRMEFLKAFGAFMQQALPAGQQVPELAPMLLQVMKFGVAGFKSANAIEGAIDQGLTQLEQAAKQRVGQPKPPSPEQQKAQADAQAEQARAQTDMAIEKMKGETQIAITRAKAQSDLATSAADAKLKGEQERWKAELSAATSIMVALIGAKAGEDSSLGLEIAGTMDELIGRLDQSGQGAQPAANEDQFPPFMPYEQAQTQ